VLKQLGVKAPKGIPAQKAIDDAKATLDSQKQRRRAAERERDELKAKNETLEKNAVAIKQYADIELGALDEKQREIIKQLAGDDPSEQLRQIAAMRAIAGANGTKASAATTEPPATTTQPPAKSAAAPPPAHTAPPAAPLPAGSQASKPVREQFADLKNITDSNQRETALLFFTLDHEQELLEKR
jgi:hypothetical protein